MVVTLDRLDNQEETLFTKRSEVGEFNILEHPLDQQTRKKVVRLKFYRRINEGIFNYGREIVNTINTLNILNILFILFIVSIVEFEETVCPGPTLR